MNNNSFTSYLQFIFENPNEDIWDSRHVFFKNGKDEVAESEEKLKRNFPRELAEFFNLVGYGFVCNGASQNINRILSPIEICDFYYGQNSYSHDNRREHYKDNEQLIFFEVSEHTFLTMDLSHPNENGQCPIFYYQKRIADSLEDFLRKMENDVDYYMKNKYDVPKQ